MKESLEEIQPNTADISRTMNEAQGFETICRAEEDGNDDSGYSGMQGKGYCRKSKMARFLRLYFCPC
ncbi:hypothetical protein, partial [Vibrio parahaemolyticus]|uniref:hypothetical protein n=1 Tax=Vibrio parahaemolyticus TaxID=670 RepID=UPI00301C0F29